MSKPSSKQPVVDTTEMAAKFWRFVETRTTVNGVETQQAPYYGLRVNDPVELNVDGKLVKTEVQNYWRSICVRRGINADLTLCSRLAVAAGLLKSRNSQGVDKKSGEKRSYGVKFWTAENACYNAKATTAKATRPSNAAIAEALGF